MIAENVVQKLTVEYTTPGADAAARAHKTVADAQREVASTTTTLSTAYSSLDSRIEKMIARVDAEANAFVRSQAALKAYTVAQNAAIEGTRLAAQSTFGSLQSTAAGIAQVTRLAAPAAGVLASGFAPALGIVGAEAAKTGVAITRELLPALGQTLSALSPILAPLATAAGAYLAAAAAIGYLAKAAHDGIAAFTEFEAGQAKLQASLTVTAGATGKSVDDIEKIVRSIGDLSATREAAAALVRLRQVMPDDAFEKTLRVAKDLSVLGFGSVSEAAKALANVVKEDPVKAFDAFEKASIRVGGAQRQMIKDLVDSGKGSEALSKTLEIIGKQAGGSAELVRGTLKGAYAELADQVKISNEEFGKQIALFLHLTDLVNLLASAMKLLNESSVTLVTVLRPLAPQIDSIVRAVEALERLGVIKKPDALDQQIKAAADQLRIDLNRELEDKRQKAERLDKVLKGLSEETFNLKPNLEAGAKVLDEMSKFELPDLEGKSKEDIKTLKEKLELYKQINDKLREAGLLNPQTEQDKKNAELIAARIMLSRRLGDTAPDAQTVDRWDTVTKSIERQTARLQADTIAIGQGAAAQERLRVEFQLLEAAKEADLGVTDEQIRKYTELRAAGKSAAEALAGTGLSQEKRDELLRLADAAGAAKEALTKLQIASNIKFESQTLGLSPEDVQIAQQLRSLYPDVATALASTEAAQLRVINGFKQARDLTVNFASSLSKDIAAGVAPMTALGNAAKQLNDTLIDIAAKKLVTQAFGGLFGDASAATQTTTITTGATSAATILTGAATTMVATWEAGAASVSAALRTGGIGGAGGAFAQAPANFNERFSAITDDPRAVQTAVQSGVTAGVAKVNQDAVAAGRAISLGTTGGPFSAGIFGGSQSSGFSPSLGGISGTGALAGILGAASLFGTYSSAASNPSATGASGALSGGLSGALSGAAIGTMFGGPLIGTAIGALAGAGLGFLGGKSGMRNKPATANDNEKPAPTKEQRREDDSDHCRKAA